VLRLLSHSVVIVHAHRNATVVDTSVQAHKGRNREINHHIIGRPFFGTAAGKPAATTGAVAGTAVMDFYFQRGLVRTQIGYCDLRTTCQRRNRGVGTV